MPLLKKDCNEWADQQCRERGDTAAEGPKRSRKANKKYANNTDGNSSNPSSAQNNNNLLKNKRKVPDKRSSVEVEGQENNGASAKQPRTTTSTVNNINDTTTSVDDSSSVSLPSLPPPFRSTSPLHDPTPPTTVNVPACQPTASDPPTSPASSPHPGSAGKNCNVAAATDQLFGNLYGVSGNAAADTKKGLKKVDDTTLPPTSKSWPCDIRDKRFISKFDSNGVWIECAACLGKGRTNGLINMRRPYDLGRWNDHCCTKIHLDGVFKFLTVKKKKKTPPEASLKTSNPNTSVIDVDVADAVDSIIPKNTACAGVFNSVGGDKKEHVKLYSAYVRPLSRQGWVVSFYSGAPSIASKSCTKKGVSLGKDGGMVCDHCKKLRLAKGGSNPGTILNRWRMSLLKCHERRKKRNNLSITDIEDATNFTKISDESFTPFGLELKRETQALVEYHNYRRSSLPFSTQRKNSNNPIIASKPSSKKMSSSNANNHDEEGDYNIILSLDVGSSGIRCLAYRLIYPNNTSSRTSSVTKTCTDSDDHSSTEDWILERVQNCCVVKSRRVVEPTTGRILLLDTKNSKKSNHDVKESNPTSLLDEIDECIDGILALLRDKYGSETIDTTSSSPLQKAKCKIVAMGVSTFAMNLVGVDENGDLIGMEQTMTYACNSKEATEECRRLRSQLSKEQQHNLYQRTGAPLHSAFALPQLRSYYSKKSCSAKDNSNSTTTANNVKYWQTISSLCLSRWLSSSSQNYRMPISYSEASWTGLLNYKSCTWDDEALKLLSKECVDALPPLVDACDVNVGEKNGGIPKCVSYWNRWPELRGAAADENDSEAVKYCRFFLGVGDGACANIGSKCTTPSRIAVTVGTSAAARVCLPLPIQPPTPTALLSKTNDMEAEGKGSTTVIVPPPGLFCYRIDKSHVLIGGALTDGGSVVEWARNFLGLSSNESFVQCMEEVSLLYFKEQRQQKTKKYSKDDDSAHDSSSITVIPFLSGERSTGYRDGATGCIMGLTRDTTPAQFVKSCLEGVILRINAILCLLQVITTTIGTKSGSSRSPCIVASGTALERNALWRQMLCDCSGLDVVMDDEVSDGTSRGAARLAAAAIVAEENYSESDSTKEDEVDGDAVSVSNLIEEKLVISECLKGRRKVKEGVEVDGVDHDRFVSADRKWAKATASQDAFLDAVSPLWK